MGSVMVVVVMWHGLLLFVGGRVVGLDRTMPIVPEDRPMTESAVKRFTVDEANATLPYVRRIVEDIVADYHRWRDCIYRYEMLAAGSRSDEGETDEQVALREEVDGIALRINGFINELSAVGCVFKGFEGGLVDFRGERDGRDVFLCWKLGEEEVAHWHEVDTGFAGRQPLHPEPVLGESS